jgi:hypothetical protein
MTNKSNLFIWTEAFNCAELLNPVLKSFCKSSEFHVNAFVFDFEFDKINFFNDQVIYHIIPTKLDIRNVKKSLIGKWIRSGYKKGHLGTARFWSYLIKSRKEKYFVHFDSDILFLADSINDFELGFSKGATCIGRRRMYLRNKNNIDKVRGIRDCIDTVFFGFKTNILRFLPYFLLTPLIRGAGSINYFWSTLDFFDKVTLILAKFGKIVYLDSPEAGVSAEVNYDSKFNKSFIEIFSAVGTGCSLWNRFGSAGSLNLDKLSDYQKHALSNYSFYAKYILKRPIDFPSTEDAKVLEKLIAFNLIEP